MKKLQIIIPILFAIFLSIQAGSTSNDSAQGNILENNNSKNQTNIKSKPSTDARCKRNVSANTSSNKVEYNNSSSKKENNSATTSKNNTTGAVNNSQSNSQTVYVTPTGRMYHLISTCGGKI